MHNPRKIVKVSPVLFTSVSQTFDEFCRQKCFTSPCLAKNKQVMATQSKLVCLKLVFVHFSSVIYGFTRLHVVFKIFREKYSERIWVFHCKYSIRKKPRVIVVALPSCMMLFDLETKLLRYSRRDFLEKIDVRTEIRTWAIR